MKRRKFIGTLSAVTFGSLSLNDFSFPATVNELTQTAKSKIPGRLLGRTGVEVSVLALGGVVAMAEKPSGKFNPVELANAALDAGINYFDTCVSYGNGQSEINFGAVVSKRRKEIFLATKTDGRTYDDVMREVEASLKRLQTDHYDLLQIHSLTKDDDIKKWGDPDTGILKAYYKLRDEKVTRFIGFTGHESADLMLQAIEMYDFDTVLTTFNPVVRRRPFEKIALPAAQKKNMGILAMKVMGGGFGSLAEGNPIKNNPARWYYDQASKQTKASTLIQYVLGLPVTTAIVGMASVEQLQLNIAAARDMKPLTEKERSELEKLMA